MARRRGFFKQMVSEALGAAEEAAGRPQFRLDEIPSLPDDVLAGLVPQVREDAEIVVTDAGVQAKLRTRQEPVVLFAHDAVDTFVFNRFNGSTPLGRAARELSAAMSLDGPDAFACARALFVRLVRLRVVVPANAGA